MSDNRKSGGKSPNFHKFLPSPWLGYAEEGPGNPQETPAEGIKAHSTP